ncbi:MAG TPA: tetratricopeptide repeat protein [Gemmataceae bacterium]|nr:tetratricopeptide repeat protein [Gemmataceae bacterium]
MKPDEPPTMSKREQLLFNYMIWIWLAPLLPLLIVILYFAFSGPSAPTTGNSSGGRQATENGLDTARQDLTRQTDLTACHRALQEVNAELSDKPARRPPALTNDQKTWLRDELSLSDEELSEVESSHYSKLDEHHLFRCFLMRDVAGTLEVKGVRGKVGGQLVREKPLDQAARAFAWVMREVRLREREGEDRRDAGPTNTAAPPSFVVRRGWGNALERALIFLALLEQLGDPAAAQPELLGFLLHIPNGSGSTRLWACAVVVGDDKEVYLFDPRLGLPLPGPKGKGIATLAQARKQPEILAQLHLGKKYQYLALPLDFPACLSYLAQLHVGEKLQYPVTAEQARAAQAHLVPPLSALSPRMRYLQDKLLAPALRVRVAADAAADYERVKVACSAGVEKPFPVVVARDYCTLVQRFLPEEEGGVDTTSRMKRFYRDLVPWNVLPAFFRDERRFPRHSELGQRVLGQFMASFYLPTMDAGRARDLLLRGRYSSVVPELVSERESWRQQLVQRANAVDLEAKAEKWLDHVTSVYARKYRAKQPRERQLAEQQVKEAWEDSAALPVAIILNSYAAVARKPEVDYQLALCAQEQAEQLQARLDLQTQVGATAHPRDVEKAQADWQNALNAWTRFDEDYPRHPDRAAARLLRGRAEAMLGEHKAAIASWKNVSGFQTDLEKLASLHLAQQWQKKHPQ